MQRELALQPPHTIGPVWRRYTDGSFVLPEKTLGWGVINWLYKYVRSPAGGGPFLPTDEQARFLAWWYAVDERGRYVYRAGVLRRMKGWGKDPLSAAMALVELCGPVAFSHFRRDGTPVGKPRHAAWIQLAAVSQDQTKNTFSLFPVMISSLMKAEYRLDVNKTIIYTAEGGRIEAVTSSPHAMEGNRPTFVIRNETQWWVEAVQGPEMASVIEGNATKIPDARVLSICNAHVPGDESEGEKDYDSWQKVESGEAVDTGIMYDALEAPAGTPVSEIPAEREDPEGFAEGIEKLSQGIRIARGDSVWLDIESIVNSVLDVRNPVTESRRKFLNQVNAAEDSWIAPYEWDAIGPSEDRPVPPLEPRQRITLGFDGSKSNDHTALTACRVEDGSIFLLRHWNPAKHPSGEIPREDVDAAVHSAFERYDVVAFRADVREFEAYVDQWGTKWRRKLKVNASPNNPVAFDMRGQQKRFAMDCERFQDAVFEREVSHDGNPIMRQHVINAHQYPTNYDAMSIRKASKDSAKKIDAAITAVLAWGARQDFLMSKKNRPPGLVVLR